MTHVHSLSASVATSSPSSSVGEPLAVGDFVIDRHLGLGQIIATPEAPGAFPPAQLQEGVAVKFKDSPVLRTRSELRRVVPVRDLVARIDKSLHKRLRSDPTVRLLLRRAQGASIDDNYVSPQEAARIESRYVRRLSAKEAWSAAEYGAYIGRSEGWVRTAVAAGRLEPEQTLVTPRGEEPLFKRQPARATLSPGEVSNLGAFMDASGFGDVAIARQAQTPAWRLDAMRQGASLLHRDAQRIRIAIQELETASVPKRALLQRLADARQQGFSYTSIGKLCGMSRHRVRTIAVEQPCCRPGELVALSTGLDEAARLSEPFAVTEFNKAELLALKVRLDALPFEADDPIPLSLTDAIVRAIQSAKARGHNEDAMAETSRIAKSTFRASREGRRTLASAKSIVDTLIRVADKSPDDLAAMRKKGLHLLRPAEVDELRDEIKTAGYNDVLLAARTGLTEEGIATIRLRTGTSRPTAARIREGIAALQAEGTPPNARIPEQDFLELKERLAGVITQGWNVEAVCAAARIDRDALYAVRRGAICLESTRRMLNTALDLLETVGQQLSSPTFSKESIEHVMQTVASLGISDTAAAPERVKRAVAAVIAEAQSIGHTIDGIAQAARLPARTFEAFTEHRRTLTVVHRTLSALRVLRRRSPEEVERKIERRGYLSEDAGAALRLAIAESRFGDATLARETGLSSRALYNIRTGHGIRRSSALLIRNAIAALVARNAPQDARVTETEFKLLLDHLQAARAAGWSFEVIEFWSGVNVSTLRYLLAERATCEFHIWKRLEDALPTLLDISSPLTKDMTKLTPAAVAYLEQRLARLSDFPDHTLVSELTGGLSQLVRAAISAGISSRRLSRASGLPGYYFENTEGDRTLYAARRMLLGLHAVLEHPVT